MAVAVAALTAAGLSGDAEAIVGGELALQCAWPTSVLTEFSDILNRTACGGTLIHPELIIVHHECPLIEPVMGPVIFGEGEFAVGQTVDPVSPVAIESCVQHFDTENALSVCRLAEPVDQLPITPIVYGCEVEILELGREVTVVGWGWDMPSPPAGTDHEKRWATTTIQGLGDANVLIPADGPVACESGDLGGPMFVQYPDGSWHLIAVANDTIDCAGDTQYKRLDRLVPWIEQTFEVDVTPCHDIDGNWDPGPDCGGFPVEGPSPGGSWADWCAGAPLLANSETCGPNGGPEEPTLTVTHPEDQAMLASGETFALQIAVNFPVDTVQPVIDGMVQAATDQTWPYGFPNVTLPDGQHSLSAVAEDGKGNSVEAEPIVVYVGVEPPTGDDTGSESESSEGGLDGSSTTSGAQPGTDDGLADDSTSGSPPQDGDEGSCACTTQRSAPGPGLALLLLGGLMRRRVRRSARPGT